MDFLLVLQRMQNDVTGLAFSRSMEIIKFDISWYLYLDWNCDLNIYNKLAGKMKDEIRIFFIDIKNRIWGTH